MNVSDLTFLGSERYDYDFMAPANALTGKTPIHKIAEDLDLPPKLIESALTEVKEECENRHIDVAKYNFVEVSQMSGVWQVTFFTSEEKEVGLTVFEVYTDDAGMILQRQFSLY